MRPRGVKKMKTEIRSKLIDVTEGMKSAYEKEFDFMKKYLREDDTLDFKLSKKKEGIKLSVQACVPHGEYVRCDVYCEDFYSGIKELKRQFKEDFLNEYKHAKDNNKKWRDRKNAAEKEYAEEFLNVVDENNDTQDTVLVE